MRCIASAKRVQVPRRDPTGGGKISERSMLIFDYTAHKSASPKNYPVFLALLMRPVGTGTAMVPTEQAEFAIVRKRAANVT